MSLVADKLISLIIVLILLFWFFAVSMFWRIPCPLLYPWYSLPINKMLFLKNLDVSMIQGNTILNLGLLW